VPDFQLAGRTRNSRLYDPVVWPGVKYSVLTTTPGFSNLRPLVPCNQVTPYRAKGSHGQRVAIKIAITAARNTALVLFRFPGAEDCSFSAAKTYQDNCKANTWQAAENRIAVRFLSVAPFQSSFYFQGQTDRRVSIHHTSTIARSNPPPL
jgi:hypothetical protein